MTMHDEGNQNKAASPRCKYKESESCCFVLNASSVVLESRNRPGFAAVEQDVEVAGAALSFGDIDLVVQFHVVLWRVDVAEHADRLGELRMPHAAEQVRQRRLGRLLVVEQQV